MVYRLQERRQIVENFFRPCNILDAIEIDRERHKDVLRAELKG